MRTDRVARSSMTTGQGARHWGASLAPATDKSSMAEASCASSLPAGAGAVTTRLARTNSRLFGADLLRTYSRSKDWRSFRRTEAPCTVPGRSVEAGGDCLTSITSLAATGSQEI